MKTILKTLVFLFCVASFAQTTVKGTVNDAVDYHYQVPTLL